MPRAAKPETPAEPAELAEVASHVRRARAAQRLYFKTRAPLDLADAQAAEFFMVAACLKVLKTPDGGPAAELARLAMDMVYAQRNYFRGKSAAQLREAKTREAHVDAQFLPDAPAPSGQREFGFPADF
jgi:hypothetical protein